MREWGPISMRRRLHSRLRLLVWLALMLGSHAKAEDMPAAPEVMILAVSINGQARDPAQFLRQGDDLYVREADLNAWGLDIPALAPLTHEGVTYLRLTDVADYSVDLDEARQTVELQLPAAVFPQSVIDAEGVRFLPPTPGSFATFFNYDLQLQQDEADTESGGLFEAGLSDDWGLITSSASMDVSERETSVVRLETAFTRDQPEDPSRLMLGDSITCGND